MILASKAAMAFLVIMGCNGDPAHYDGTQCEAENRPESWVSVKGSDPKEECERFIHDPDFDPKDYMPGYDYYGVRCER